jgi:hypothetical protein
MVLVEKLDGFKEQASRRANRLIDVFHQSLTADSWHGVFSSDLAFQKSSRKGNDQWFSDSP